MLNFLAIKCIDLEASRSFYVGLGLTFEEEKHGGGLKHYSTHMGPVVLELYPSDEQSYTTRVVLGLAVSDLTEVLSSFGKSTQDLILLEGHKALILKDPNENRVIVSEIENPQ